MAPDQPGDRIRIGCGVLAALRAYPLISGTPAGTTTADLAVTHRDTIANVDPDTARTRLGGCSDITKRPKRR